MTEIKESAFAGCTCLVDVKLPASLESISRGAFLQCENLSTLKVPATVKQMGENVFNDWYIRDLYVYSEECAEEYAVRYALPYRHYILSGLKEMVRRAKSPEKQREVIAQYVIRF